VVYDVCGRKVKRLVEGVKERGKYVVEWGMKDENGKRLGSGVYFYHFRIGEKRGVKKLTYIR